MLGQPNADPGAESDCDSYGSAKSNGHRNRRAEGIPVLMAKCEAALRAHLAAPQVDRILQLAANPAQLEAMPIEQFMNLYRA